LIVSSPQADEILWSEVLWRGAYDLLVEPYESDELRNTLEGALRASQTSRLAASAAHGIN
jgi:FixJ family two-component response regulator